MKTYWIVRGEAGDAGWEDGLPPSITAEMWPRSDSNGMPLVHGFTLRVPEAYRAKGKELVGFSYFHPGNSEGASNKREVRDRVQAIMKGGGLEGDEASQPFYQALVAHRDHRPERTVQRIEDILGHPHVIVWHTEEQLNGPRSEPPREELPEGLDPSTMFLEERNEEQKLTFAAEDPGDGDRHIQLGGPLHWVQGEVDGFGEIVMEIEDGVGNANYGCGNCQVDLENDLLDWAC